MEFAAAASLALRRIADSGENFLIRRRPGEDDVPAAQLADELAARALDLAAQFDARNGTDHQSSEIRAVLGAEPWIDYLPLSETARRAYLHQTRRVTEPVIEDSQVRPEPTGAGWLDRAEDAWQTDRREEALAAWKAFEEQVPPAERTKLDQARLLDGRGLASADQIDIALEAWRRH